MTSWEAINAWFILLFFTSKKGDKLFPLSVVGVVFTVRRIQKNFAKIFKIAYYGSLDQTITLNKMPKLTESITCSLFGGGEGNEIWQGFVLWALRKLHH